MAPPPLTSRLAAEAKIPCPKPCGQLWAPDLEGHRATSCYLKLQKWQRKKHLPAQGKKTGKHSGHRGLCRFEILFFSAWQKASLQSCCSDVLGAAGHHATKSQRDPDRMPWKHVLIVQVSSHRSRDAHLHMERTPCWSSLCFDVLGLASAASLLVWTCHHLRARSRNKATRNSQACFGLQATVMILGVDDDHACKEIPRTITSNTSAH